MAGPVECIQIKWDRITFEWFNNKSKIKSTALFEFYVSGFKITTKNALGEKIKFLGHKCLQVPWIGEMSNFNIPKLLAVTRKRTFKLFSW